MRARGDGRAVAPVALGQGGSGDHGRVKSRVIAGRAALEADLRDIEAVS